ncbi:MAG TPA: hypothetical protein DEH78_08985 [Solibacterales bacterium]|nr:hypothetical protein [Bryobacterales bacterium]
MKSVNAARRAYMRLSAPVFAVYAVAFDMDHAICPDGYGSASLHSSMEREIEDLVARVADRFGVEVAQLEREIARFENEVWQMNVVER